MVKFVFSESCPDRSRRVFSRIACFDAPPAVGDGPSAPYLELRLYWLTAPLIATKWSDELAMVTKLFRIALPVGDIEKAVEFYSRVLEMPGERVWVNRHYFDCGGTILACVDPMSGPESFRPNPNYVYFAVSDLDAVYERVKQAGCKQIDDSVQSQPWGERMFFAEDPFGNPICFVDEGTLFTGAR